MFDGFSRSVLLVISCWMAVGMIGCHTNLSVAKDYYSRGNWPLAMELLAAEAQQSDAANEELDAMLLVTDQMQQFKLRNEMDRLQQQRSYLMALQRWLALAEHAQFMASVGRKTVDQASLDEARTTLVSGAVETLQTDFEERQSRDTVLPTDLRVCRQLEALATDDLPKQAADVASQCDRLLRALEVVASMHLAPQSQPLGNTVMVRIAKEVDRRNPEIFRLTSQDASDRNAALTLNISGPEVVESEWYESSRFEVHKMLPKLDKKGRPVTEKVRVIKTVKVKPTQREYEAALAAGEPPPKVREIEKQVEVEKKVYEPVDGTVVEMRRDRKFHMSFWLQVEHLRSHSILTTLADEVEYQTHSTYEIVTGHPRMREIAGVSGTPETASEMESVEALTGRALDHVVSHLANTLIERMQ